MKIRMLPLLAILLATVAVPARSADRTAAILVPNQVAPGADFRVVLLGSTDALDGEKIGFLHADYSVDGGKHWVSLCYLENGDTDVDRAFNLTAGPLGSKILVRLRVAFRGGRAGDVDYRGGPIEWDGNWAGWRAPPARFAIIYVR
jgi:hypothetical protein